ncbi:hypothetical protein MPTK1_5g01790 [Marchantia polymorpha subsp. ruderalis]|uniref:Uncharacterized protein n=2 Tax=Marchantia polymorpha TaxID=3197 RepID=A0AAF6BDW5_MARPO|nr:hypothetical protein MARPO_0161s0025 [Marchantia polymorpha]BBN10199.1 hypothetical protein Mp_5g01790 [Marchantia polymorpha subsp. ruderalis]|eukprot:PTQ28528.1 hypothetical protein MARPO_0161s0025 [Marchantia polymorpha]
MAAQGSSGAGGPLLRVADMLQDLAQDSSSETFFKKSFSSDSPDLSPSAQNFKPGLKIQDLPTAFEETYSELNVALSQSGHTWTGLTQQLCATLTTADKLTPTSQLHLGQLSQELKKLEKIVERGQEAVVRLQLAMGQPKDEARVS